MTITAFPPVEQADEDGLLAMGGDLEVASLLLAYRKGIFPWPLDTNTLAWFSPPMRAILRFDTVHFSQRFERTVRSTSYTVRSNTCFQEVITGCAKAKNRKGQRGTWITPAMIKGYTTLHHAGFASSFECFDGATLVGGVYGVAINSFFAAESMFYRAPDASKIALWHLIEHLKIKGITWIDVQVLNAFTLSIGAEEVTRAKYLSMLDEALSRA